MTCCDVGALFSRCLHTRLVLLQHPLKDMLSHTHRCLSSELTIMPCRTYAPANSAQAALASAKQMQGAVPSGFSKGGFESTVEGTHAEVAANYGDAPANGTGPAVSEAAAPQQPHAAAAAPGGELSEAASLQAEVVAMAWAAAAAAGVVLPPDPAATAPAEEALHQALAQQLPPSPAAVPAAPKSASERAGEIAARLAAASTGVASVCTASVRAAT